ncbi:LPS assembly lipoprotein LptE [Planctomicrobium piriforme]|uniref:Lipopolysaccharide-assembly n=1 Tax=Planctomicrobium piriforme TaxID=1576369 RepID=A0A1I3T6Y4_9PLAN|nr:LPS assembly lipoprotein LptE [Planctomicrobium piriforme]SFJ66898.1 Lipopolysaccharide-assembly [Planctomicrobium piriforme]
MVRVTLQRREFLLAALTAGLGTLLSGCGYVVGSPYGPEVRTIHVPTFTNDAYKAAYTNDGYRRGFELQLTEAIQKQIQLRTPYRLVDEPGADTRLSGRLVSVSKRVANQNQYDDPRELEFSMGVEIVWEDLRNGQVLAQQTVPLNAQVAQSIVNTSFAPEPGQSLATATQDAVDQMARQIVSLMETPW